MGSISPTLSSLTSSVGFPPNEKGKKLMERGGNLKELWVTCPSCKKFFNVETLFWEDAQFAELFLHCPFCETDFDKKDSPKLWGRE